VGFAQTARKKTQTTVLLGIDHHDGNKTDRRHVKVIAPGAQSEGFPARGGDVETKKVKQNVGGGCPGGGGVRSPVRTEKRDIRWREKKKAARKPVGNRIAKR